MLKEKKNAKNSQKQRTLLSKVVELVTSEIKPSIKTDGIEESLPNNPMGNFSSVMLNEHQTRNASEHTSKPAHPCLSELLDLNALSVDTTTLLQTLKLSPEQYIDFIKKVINRADDELQQSTISGAIDQWHDLYENFRIGLQLGFRYFTDALINSDEELPEQEEVGSPWSWRTWETMVGNLLNNFDLYCAKEVTDYIKAPGTLIDEPSIHEIFKSLSNSHHGESLLEAAFSEIEKAIVSTVDLLQKKLQMSDKLENIIHTPSAIANDFETYLWANYITKRKIGTYGNSLRDRLLLTPRIAPKGQVTARLKFLKVAEADELDEIAGRRGNDQLKRLHDWARENVCEFNIWEKICYDSTRFLPRSTQQ